MTSAARPAMNQTWVVRWPQDVGPAPRAGSCGDGVKFGPFERPRGVAAPRVVHRQADPGHRPTLSAPSETPTPRDNGRTRNSPRRRVQVPATVPWTRPTAHRNTSHKIPVPYTGRRACPHPSAPRRAVAPPARGSEERHGTGYIGAQPRPLPRPERSGRTHEPQGRPNGRSAPGPNEATVTNGPRWHEGCARPLRSTRLPTDIDVDRDRRRQRSTSTAIDVGARQEWCGVSLTPDRDAEPSHTRTNHRALPDLWKHAAGSDTRSRR